MADEAHAAARNIDNLDYTQQAMKKAMTAMLKLSMATMYKDAMNKAVEANFKEGIKEYHGKAYNMAESWNKMKRQNAIYQKR